MTVFAGNASSQNMPMGQQNTHLHNAVADAKLKQQSTLTYIYNGPRGILNG
jgi:hypothetical protein